MVRTEVNLKDGSEPLRAEVEALFDIFLTTTPSGQALQRAGLSISVETATRLVRRVKHIVLATIILCLRVYVASKPLIRVWRAHRVAVCLAALIGLAVVCVAWRTWP